MILNYRVYPMKIEKPSFVPFLSFYLPLHSLNTYIFAGIDFCRLNFREFIYQFWL